MNIRLTSMLLIVGVIVLLSVFFGAAKSQDSGVIAIEPSLQSRFDAMIAREQRGFVVPPKGFRLDDEFGERSGRWIEEDGVLHCDGYLTRIAEEKFCSAEVPSDWQPFEFNGDLYFIQPLSD